MTRSSEGFGLRLNHRLTESNWLRKTQSQFGWDWSPRLVNVGIPGSVSLEISSGVRCDAVVVLTDLTADFGLGTVTAKVIAENLTSMGCPAEIHLHVKKAGQKLCVPVFLNPDMNTIEAQIPVTAPQLWWPVGHGQPNRYQVTVELRVKGKVEASPFSGLPGSHNGISPNSAPLTPPD